MPLEIAIIGAGIAGLTAAASLGRSKHRIQVRLRALCRPLDGPPGR